MCKLILASRKEIDANRGFIGLNPDGDISEGYDGYLHMVGNDPEDYSYLTIEERKEIADIMISRWTKFKVALLTAGL